jgi:ATP/maltotriose-dependent transcriptional regulator MalT
LTWIAAPPGAGKTTLLASYLEKRALKGIWYRLDAGDDDPSTLFRYLGLAVQDTAPRFRTRLPHLTPEYMAGRPIFTQRFFEQLCGRFRHPTMIVFDNYQEVPLQSLVHQLLPVGIQQLPRHIRMVVLSRERPPAAYARLQAEQHLSTVEASDLELTCQEARQLSQLQQTSIRSKPAYDTIDQLWDMTKGWVAGFVLLLKQQRQRPITNLETSNSPQAIFDYLAGEVMGRFPQDTQKVLLTMSILSDFTRQMAQQLSSLEHADDILDQLHQSHYFIERREDRLGWYRFHPLFQEFLLRRAEQVWPRATLDDLRRKAAALLVEAHLEEDALHLLQQAQAWDDYRSLIRAQAPILAQQGRLQTMAAWIGQLPEAQRDSDPWMDYWLANSRLLVSPQEASALYESAMTRFRQQGERAGMLLAWAGAVQAILVAWTGMKHLHDLVRVFDELHPEGTAYPSLEVEAIVAQAMAGTYMQMYTDRPQAQAWLDRSVALAHALPVAMRASEVVMTTVYCIWLAEGEKARTLFAQRKKIWADDSSVSVRLMMATAESMLFWNSGQVKRCQETVTQALQLAEREGLLVWSALLHAQGSYNQVLFGNIGMARNHLRLMEPFSQFGSNRFIFLMITGWADLIEGRIDQAWQNCRQGQAILEAEGYLLWHTGMYCLLAAQVLAAKGQRAEAEQLLVRAETAAQVIPGFHVFGICFARAQWAFQDGDEEQGLLWLRRLLDEGKKYQQITYIGWIPAEASRLFAKALEYGMEVPYVQESIRKWQLKPPVDGPVPETWPWRVKIRIFGKLAVKVDGKPLEKQRKAPHRLLELLAAIIAFGGQEVPVSQVIDAMWPEADGDTAHENFKKSLARLRKLLAVNDVIQWQDGKLSLNPDLCWVDALVFERQAKQHDGRATALYTGPFLGHDEIPAWAVSRRERMHATYVSLVKHREGRNTEMRQSGDRGLVLQTKEQQVLKSTPSRDSK